MDSKQAAKPLRGDQRTELVKALSHPLRFRILEILNRKTASPRDLSEEIGAKLGDVAYHVGKLRELGCVELVRTEPRRGATKHFYRATTRAMLDSVQFAELPVSLRRQIFGQEVQVIGQHIAEAAAAQGFDRHDLHVSWTHLDLDERAYREVVDLVDETLERAMAIQAESIERAAQGEPAGELVHTELALLHFLRATAARVAAVEDVRETADPVRERVFEVSDAIAAEVPRESPDWEQVAAQAAELQSLARESAGS